MGVRPAPDTMAILTGYLPVEQAVACYAALTRHTDRLLAEGDERTRDQIMADTLVEWLTGQGHAEDLDIEVQISIPLDALLDTDFADPAATDTSPSTGSGQRVANLLGYGPLPAELAREIISGSRGRRWWRRLFTAPSGQLVGGDPTRRRFDGWLARLIGLRDQTCRDPFCDAPIRHLDHIHRWSDGGPTTLANGRGTCARGNLVREMPGWQVTLVHAGQLSEPHTVQVTTPTGHSYLSRAPNPP